MLITRYDIASPSITHALRAVLLTDLHNKPFEDIVEQVRSLHPDLILIAGDLVDRHRRTYRRVKPFLRSISTVAPCYFSFGNHEIKFPKIKAPDIEACGVTVLNNRYIRFGDLAIGGQTSMAPTGWLSSLEQADGFRVLLCHHPEYYKKQHLEDRDLDLILSGHAHGGQFRFWDRGVYAPGQGLFPKYTHGRYGNMIVSAGLANTLTPLIPRIGNPCEIVDLHFLPAED
jgi:predicted MPP superfamily phosphohydrolase